MSLLEDVEKHLKQDAADHDYIDRLRQAAEVLLQYVPKHAENCQCDCCTAAGVMRYVLAHRS